MRIAFVKVERNHVPHKEISDYQLDCLFHGLKVSGHEVLEYGNFNHMYSDLRPENKKEIWGKGFTVYGNLDREQYPQIDRKGKRELQEVDLVIVGYHHSSGPVGYEIAKPFIQKMNNAGKRVVFVDGWDQPKVDGEISSMCKYFKRELYEPHNNVFPLSFAIPEEKINIDGDKKQDFSPLIPVNQSVDLSYMKTYIYDDESSYYQMYGNSRFAFTSKKGGWDTMRHYEIMANGCLPVFVDIDKCPELTLNRFPKELCKRINKLPFKLNLKREHGLWTEQRRLTNCASLNFEGHSLRVNGLRQYKDLVEESNSWIKEKGTTKQLAEYLLGICYD